MWGNDAGKAKVPRFLKILEQLFREVMKTGLDDADKQAHCGTE